MTYDLREEYLRAGYSEEETAEFDRPFTIEAIAQALVAAGHDVDRIGHLRQLVARLAAGDRWDLVFNIAEGLRGIAREAQVPALLDAYEIPYTFSDPMILSLTLHKGMTKRVMRDAGLPTPAFAEVAHLDDLAHVNLSYPLFAKPLAEGTGKGIDGGSILRSPAELRARCAYLLERFAQPVLVEEYLPGREFTVGIVGTGARAQVIGTFEVILGDKAEADVYSYTNKEFCEGRVEYRLVRPDHDPQVLAAEAAALGVWRVLGCRDAGRIDLRCDAAGAPQLMELNPLAGMHPEHSDLPMIATAAGISFPELVGRIVRSACERVPGVCGQEVSAREGGGAAQHGVAGGGA
jgi:D-alanine-D-alanine ligase